MMTAEAREKKAIRAYLDSIGAWHQVVHMTGYGPGGSPDIIGCMYGWFFSIEVKRPGKEPTPRQNTRMRDIQSCCGKCYWGTADKVIPALREWRRELLAQ